MSHIQFVHCNYVQATRVPGDRSEGVLAPTETIVPEPSLPRM
jgi:hypothetical protein